MQRLRSLNRLHAQLGSEEEEMARGRFWCRKNRPLFALLERVVHLGV